jgi:hypothetical protein
VTCVSVWRQAERMAVAWEGQAAAEVFGWNAQAGDVTGSAWAADAVPPPPFDWSEDALEDKLERELAALDAAADGAPLFAPAVCECVSVGGVR